MWRERVRGLASKGLEVWGEGRRTKKEASNEPKTSLKRA
jgi:hypothetical protein